MPKRNDINHVLVIGSGPIVIGQACEFDYSGTQACRVLKDEGLRVTLVMNWWGQRPTGLPTFAESRVYRSLASGRRVRPPG